MSAVASWSSSSSVPPCISWTFRWRTAFCISLLIATRRFISFKMKMFRENRSGEVWSSHLRWKSCKIRGSSSMHSWNVKSIVYWMHRGGSFYHFTKLKLKSSIQKPGHGNPWKPFTNPAARARNGILVNFSEQLQIGKSQLLCGWHMTMNTNRISIIKFIIFFTALLSHLYNHLFCL